MKDSEWEDGLLGWLKRHPLRTPPAGFEEGFRRQVMARIRAGQALDRGRGQVPVRTPRWTLEPRWGLAWSGALAAVLVAAILILPARLANHAAAPSVQEQEVVQEANLLFEVGEVAHLADVDLEGELQEHDRLVLAEAVPAQGDAWADFENDIELLDLLEEEENNPEESRRVTDEELQEELRQLDDAEMAAT